ncbi:hypothetical protein HGT73_05315 [Rosenbergiella australiborealis]|uniref:Uncharacterized protein n=1 Tax=Rosenbergiella australiborealis TaxID=1544696 RepID=A0ABS5T3B2_9GAMM|nr:hypothetical protein [Rosenbergiella australiborealis]MBT0726806.1 hypothetical protein [Rosenbergiella australiborealis]
MPTIATVKIDWFRVITDITRKGIPLQAIAKELDVSKSAIIGWKQGAAPNHHTGEALINFWCYVTHHERPELPVVVISKRFVYGWHRRAPTP